MANPRKIVKHLQNEIDAAVNMLLADAGLPDEGFKYFVTDTVRGRTNYLHMNLTVPLTAYKWGFEFFLYYVSHELAHIYTSIFVNEPHEPHGPEFMENFKRICPKDYWHYETGYKPRHAAKAGIKTKGRESTHLFT